MSLRYQIIFRILCSSLCILVLGGAIVVWQARLSVEKEVDASIRLALQLITLGITDTSSLQQINDLSRLSALRQTRHLSIQLHKPDGQLVHFSGEPLPSHSQDLPPAWFIHWVKGEYPKVQHQLKTEDGETVSLIIEAQPLDEITEVWQESVAFFTSISALTLLTFLAVNLVFNKSLKSIEVIVSGLQTIETGQYRYKLPPFSTQEFDAIANAINHMTGELEKTRQENRALTQHSLAIQEEERQHLSQELHDELGQSLTAIKVMAVAAAHRNADTEKITASIGQICDHLMSVVRSMMQQLHPLMLTELGLRATLEDLLNHWSERNPNLQLEIDCDEAVDTLDKNLIRQLFRVIQECLTNALRHAKANRLKIDLYFAESGKRLELKVADDGQGCNPDTLKHGFGLRGMAERIRSLDGEFSVSSRPGQGMTITASIPLT